MASGSTGPEMVVEKHLRDAFGKIPIAKLTTDHLSGYLNERKAEGIANATINRELALLRRAFNLGRLTTPPKVARLPRFQMLKENNVRKGFFEHDAYVRLRQELPAELRPVLTFAYYTGCRRGEILSLQWSQIDLDARMVRLEPGTTKNDEARNIPLSLTPELYETIKMQKATRDQNWPESPWVFSREGKRMLSFKNRWSASCERAERSDKLFHGLRRTGVRNLVRAGVPEKVAMRISGHTRLAPCSIATTS